MFDTAYLATHSLTGAKSSRCDGAKEAIPVEKVEAIINFVSAFIIYCRIAKIGRLTI